VFVSLSTIVKISKLCSQADPGKLEAELPNGLIMGHAYSITGVKLVIYPQVSVVARYC